MLLDNNFNPLRPFRRKYSFISLFCFILSFKPNSPVNRTLHLTFDFRIHENILHNDKNIFQHNMGHIVQATIMSQSSGAFFTNKNPLG